MQNFAGEMHHHELRHLSSTLLEEIKAWSSSCPLLLAQGSMEVHSITGDSAVISRQWVGELSLFGPSGKGEHRRHIVTTGLFFFCCIAELAIKPCRSSRSKLRGEFGIPKHLTSSPRARTCQSPHPHLACHCGRSRLATNIPNSLPSHLYTQPSVIPLSHSFFFGSVLLGFFFCSMLLG